MQRRLAAILAADVAGYSRLMEADEAGTFARLRSIRQELFDPTVAKHGGRTFNVMGDGFLRRVRQRARDLMRWREAEPSSVAVFVSVSIRVLVAQSCAAHREALICHHPAAKAGTTGQAGVDVHIALTVDVNIDVTAFSRQARAGHAGL